MLLAHEETYLRDLEQLCEATGKDKMTDDVKHRHAVLEKKNSVYIHPESYKCASLAAGSVLQVSELADRKQKLVSKVKMVRDGLVS